MRDKKTYFTNDNGLLVCNITEKFLHELSFSERPREWLFPLGTSKIGLKAVFLQNGNKYPKVVLVHIHTHGRKLYSYCPKKIKILSIHGTFVLIEKL